MKESDCLWVDDLPNEPSWEIAFVVGSKTDDLIDIHFEIVETWRDIIAWAEINNMPIWYSVNLKYFVIFRHYDDAVLCMLRFS